MSNRDGKGAKRRKGQKVSHSRPGQLCPRCRKGKLKAMYRRPYPKKHMKTYAFCESRSCHFSNF
ncbi:hypothetical protein [Vibrio owensii]|uniref:hypothetical protein n=1 Tax=Vibrio owensii TaxID=696485 RepID=UPI00406773DA